MMIFRLDAWRNDLSAGVVVFLVALPLSLGVALASGAPLYAGIIAGIIGGAVVSLFSGSELSISGPAAGLSSIVAAAILSLGSFPAFLAALVLAGVLQLTASAIRAGTLVSFIPHSVIKGMLAAIGITIILKQVPHAIGYDMGFTDEETAFGGWEWLNIFLAPARAFDSEVVQPGAVLITLLSLAILIAWEHPAIRRRRIGGLLPGALLCVVAGTSLNQLFGRLYPAWQLTADRDHLVALPLARSWDAVLGWFTFPDFQTLARSDVWGVALTIALVASIESLLAVEAIEKMDPEKRLADPNRELLAQGIGNTLSGLIGGLPITAVIVRSSTNVYAGARTRMSAFTYGILLLLAVLLIPTWLNAVPLACLASILLVVGYRLSSVQLMRSMWREGRTQFLPFLATFLVVIVTDILIGVFIGLLVSLFFVLRSYRRSAITIVHQDDRWLLRFNKDLSFVNRSQLKEALRSIPDHSTVVIDGTKALYVDHDIYETIRDFQLSAANRGMEIEFHNLLGQNAEQPSR